MSQKHDSTFRVVKADSALVKSLVASIRLFNNGALFAKASGRIDSSAPSGTYYLHLLDSAELAANGNVTFLLHPIKIIHTTGTDSPFDVDCTPDYIKAKDGICMVLSSTEFTLTILTTAYMAGSFLYK